MLKTNSHLLATYLTANMQGYFLAKFPHHAAEEVLTWVAELLKYFTLAHYTQGPIPFDETLDEVWHLWLLQTQQYQELMQQLPGKRFIHHSSVDYPGTAQERRCRRQAAEEAVTFLVAYVNAFGPFTAQNIGFWPVAHNLWHSFGEDWQQFNGWLQGLWLGGYAMSNPAPRAADSTTEQCSCTLCR